MAEKKVKIDLKARLGRASSKPSDETAVPGAVPPPTGLAPPPGVLGPGGIPAPVFQAKPKKPKIDQDNPYAAVSADSVGGKPQEIKVEIGHEVIKEQRKKRAIIVVGFVIGCVLGVSLGWALGSAQTKSKENEKAVAGAQELAAKIESSSGEVTAMGQKIDAATKSLYKEKKFPDKFAEQLKDTDISFSAADLAGKNLNRLKPQILRGIFDYARDAQELQNEKDSIRRLFEARGKAIRALLESGKSPKIEYIAFVAKDRKGNPVGTFAKVKAFPFEKDWPKEITIIGKANEEIKSERYKSGDVFLKHPKKEGDKPTIYSIPLEPDGIKRAFPPALGKRVQERLKKAAELIKGSAPGTTRPGDEKPGLIKLGEELLGELKAVGAAR